MCHHVHINHWRTRDNLSHVLNYSISLIYNNISNYNALAIRERLIKLQMLVGNRPLHVKVPKQLLDTKCYVREILAINTEQRRI